MARHKHKFNNASEHNGLALRHPALNSIEMLEIAELAVPDTPKPAQRSYHSPTPEQETFGFKQRRSARLIPTQKPIEWFDTFDKFMTQETQKRRAKD